MDFVAAIRSEADNFSSPHSVATVESSFYAEYKPIVSIGDSDSKVEFQIIGSPNHYLDLSDSFLYIRLQLIADGKKIAANEDVSSVNNLLHSLFSKVDVYFNNQIVGSSGNNYAYKAYLESLLSFEKNYINSQGQCPLFCIDTDGNKLTIDNEDHEYRKSLLAKSAQLEFIDKLRVDIFNQPKYLINDVDVNVSLTRSINEFVVKYKPDPLKTDISPVIKLMVASLFVRKQVLYPSLIHSHQKLLENGQRARYATKKTEVKFFTVPQGNTSFIEENVFLGTIPNRMVIGFVESSSFNGSYAENLFRFNHFGACYLSVCVNEIPTTIKPLNSDFEKKMYLQAYYMLFTSLGLNSKNHGLLIDRESFKNGSTLFAYDLTAMDKADSNLWISKKVVQLKLSVIFKKL